jgi:LysM repeat protein
MNNGWPGFLAIVLFLILILFFLASAATPEVVAEPQRFNNTGTVLSATSAGDNNLSVAPLAPASVPQPLIMPTQQPGAAVYVVQPGDWLADIARRYNTTVAAILAVNPELTDPNVIYPGEILVLP